jgi:predicted small secreted protein
MKYFLSAIVLPCAVIAALLAACNATDAGSLCPVPSGTTAAEALMAQQSCSACVQRKLLVPLRCTRPVDILFVIDNSASMSPKQKALANAIPQFIGAIDSMGLDYHVGVVTTDLGYNVPNGTSTGQPFAGAVIPACNTAAGDDGVLQTTRCVNRPGLTGEAAAACASLCPDPSFVPLGGLRYILKKDELT